MELEALVDEPVALAGGFTLNDGILSFAPLLTHFALARPDIRTGASLFHGTLIQGFIALARHGAAVTGLKSIALGGGCLMNCVLAEGLSAALAKSDLTPLLARRLPANDGGLSFGQAVLARRAFSEI